MFTWPHRRLKETFFIPNISWTVDLISSMLRVSVSYQTLSPMAGICRYWAQMHFFFYIRVIQAVRVVFKIHRLLACFWRVIIHEYGLDMNSKPSNWFANRIWRVKASSHGTLDKPDDNTVNLQIYLYAADNSSWDWGSSRTGPETAYTVMPLNSITEQKVMYVSIVFAQFRG